MTPLIGIVTVLFNGDQVLPGFFESVAKQTDVCYRLYVIDNSNSDSGTQLAKKLAKQYGIEGKFVFNNANYGVAKGNNQGIELALHDECSHILLANNDVEFEGGTLSELLQALIEKNESVATPKILYFGTEALIWYAGGSINRWTLTTPHFNLRKKDVSTNKSPYYTNYAPTCFMLLKSEVFSQVGMMDEKYFVYYDDTDFVWRLNKQNYRIRLLDHVIVQHKVSFSTGGDKSQFSVFYTNRNRIYFARKNLTGFNRIFTLGFILITRLIPLITLPKSLKRGVLAGCSQGLTMNIDTLK